MQDAAVEIDMRLLISVSLKFIRRAEIQTLAENISAGHAETLNVPFISFGIVARLILSDGQIAADHDTSGYDEFTVAGSYRKRTVHGRIRIVGDPQIDIPALHFKNAVGYFFRAVVQVGYRELGGVGSARFKRPDAATGHRHAVGHMGAAAHPGVEFSGAGEIGKIDFGVLPGNRHLRLAGGRGGGRSDIGGVADAAVAAHVHRRSVRNLHRSVAVEITSVGVAEIRHGALSGNQHPTAPSGDVGRTEDETRGRRACSAVVEFDPPAVDNRENVGRVPVVRGSERVAESHAAAAYDRSALPDGKDVVGRQKRKIDRIEFLRSVDHNRFQAFKPGTGIVHRFFNRACVE